MSSTASSNATLERFQSIIAKVSRPPYCVGFLELDTSDSNLFYRSVRDETKAEIIDFRDATDEQLQQLSEACQKATFGMNQQDVLDESYRKAGKMDPVDFSVQFSPFSTGVMNIVHEQLFAGKVNSDAVLEAELYKLNIYGPGSFFKSHVDTPRSDTMVGSLVVVLPTKHEGGSLIFRHQGQENRVDTAEAASAGQSAFVAFFSDVEHEVAEVTSGYRVTLTYNLFMDDKASSPVLSASNEELASLKSSLKDILSDPEFLPDGGFLGFGLTHVYPVNPSTTQLKGIVSRLKGADAAILLMCHQIGLRLSLRAVYAEEPRSRRSKNVMCLLMKLPALINHGDPLEDHHILAYLENLGGDLAYNYGDSIDDYEDIPGCDSENFFPIAWMKPQETHNKFGSPYIAYGNEATLDFVYGEVCFVAKIGEPGDRGLVL